MLIYLVEKGVASLHQEFVQNRRAVAISLAKKQSRRQKVAVEVSRLRYTELVGAAGASLSFGDIEADEGNAYRLSRVVRKGTTSAHWSISVSRPPRRADHSSPRLFYQKNVCGRAAAGNRACFGDYFRGTSGASRRDPKLCSCHPSPLVLVVGQRGESHCVDHVRPSRAAQIAAAWPNSRARCADMPRKMAQQPGNAVNHVVIPLSGRKIKPWSRQGLNGNVIKLSSSRSAGFADAPSLIKTGGKKEKRFVLFAALDCWIHFGPGDSSSAEETVASGWVGATEGAGVVDSPLFFAFCRRHDLGQYSTVSRKDYQQRVRLARLRFTFWEEEEFLAAGGFSKLALHYLVGAGGFLTFGPFFVGKTQPALGTKKTFLYFGNSMLASKPSSCSSDQLAWVFVPRIRKTPLFNGKDVLHRAGQGSTSSQSPRNPSRASPWTAKEEAWLGRDGLRGPVGRCPGRRRGGGGARDRGAG